MSMSFIMALIAFLTACSSDKKEDGVGIAQQNDETKLELSIKIPPGGNSWAINDMSENESLI